MKSLALWWLQRPRRERRTLAVCGLILAIAVAGEAAVKPYLATLRSVSERADRERDMLVREQRLLAEATTYPERFPRAEAALLAEAPRLFGAPDLATASAALVNYVSVHGIRHRVFVQQSATGEPEQGSGGVASIHVELQAVGDLQGILEFLQALESGSKLLTIERLAIAQAARVSGRETSDEEMLALTATVTGYALSELAE